LRFMSNIAAISGLQCRAITSSRSVIDGSQQVQRPLAAGRAGSLCVIFGDAVAG
jgi:hypothetical protein